jgi:anti-sigma B factor antagonist
MICMAAPVAPAPTTTCSGCIPRCPAVQFLGGHGLSALLKLARAAENRRQPLRIAVDHHQPVIGALEITGLEEFLALYHSVEDALYA